MAAFIESLPFCFRDVTSGAENEFQAVVLGKREDVDLPITIESANFFKNMARRAASGDTSPKTVTALERYLEKKNDVWENSWVRIPEQRLNTFARQVFASDLLADKANPDAFYRYLFMRPCLPGWNKGEEKHAYMKLCHDVLSRSQINGIAKLEEAGIINSNLVILPSSSNISLANNGTHISIGSRKLSRLLADPGSGFTAVHENHLGDLVIKVAEHFLCLFPGTYSASPFRLNFEDFHPEKILGFLPHELDYTHLRMPLYQLVRLREFHRMGYSGFEHRHYSIFEDIPADMGGAADLQTLITALAFQYILNGEVTHAMIDTLKTDGRELIDAFRMQAVLADLQGRINSPDTRSAQKPV